MHINYAKNITIITIAIIIIKAIFLEFLLTYICDIYYYIKYIT